MNKKCQTNFIIILDNFVRMIVSNILIVFSYFINKLLKYFCLW